MLAGEIVDWYVSMYPFKEDHYFCLMLQLERKKKDKYYFFLTKLNKFLFNMKKHYEIKQKKNNFFYTYFVVLFPNPLNPNTFHRTFINYKY